MDEGEKEISAAIAKWHADYNAAFSQWHADYKGLFELLLNPQMSRREKRRCEKAERRRELAQRKKAKRKK